MPRFDVRVNGHINTRVKKALSDPNKPFKARICWGSEFPNDHVQVEVYEFTTENERSAFHLGILAAEGWVKWHGQFSNDKGEFPEEMEHE